MAILKKTDLPEFAAHAQKALERKGKRDKQKKREQLKEQLKPKKSKWADMTKAEKDDLLRAIAVHLDLIEE